MTRITTASVPAFLAFGNASMAICNVNELARRRQLDARAVDLLVEIKAAHVQLRELFDQGLDDAACVLSHHVMELAFETTVLLNQNQ